MAETEHHVLPLVCGNPYFATTHWSVVLQAGEGRSSESTAALEKLCRTYWFPLYAFVRRQGQSEENAKDLTQQFFELLLERQDFRTVDARKGKFRTFLLTSLSHFLSNERDRQQAVKRGGGRTIISFDEMQPDHLDRFGPSFDLTPDKLFDQRWAMALLAEAVSALRREMVEEGKQSYFDALKAFLTNEPRDGEYGETARLLGTSDSNVGVMVHRMRKRYRELVRAEVANTVSSPTELEEEMLYLRAVLVM